MNIFKKAIALLLLLSLVNLYTPAKSCSKENIKKLDSDIIEYEPESSTTVEKELPTKESGGKWIWAILGVALIGGVAAVVGGGGSEGGGDGGGSTTGNYNFSW
jgi:hypothetical protein